MQRLTHQRKKAFTLAEVLIALALLGVVAAFGIPKLLHAMKENDRTAKIRETVGIIENVWHSALLEGTCGPNKTGGSSCSLYDIMVPRINYLDKGATRGDTCSGLTFAGWMTLPNRVTVCGIGWPVTPLSNLGNYNYILFLRLPDDPTVYSGNFNPQGDFDGPGLTTYQANTVGKSFLWPKKGQSVYACCNEPPTGATSGLNTNSTKQIGDYLTN